MFVECVAVREEKMSKQQEVEIEDALEMEFVCLRYVYPAR